MKIRTFFFSILLASATASFLPLHAEEPLIPPSISKIWPAGMQRGTTVTFAIDGRNLAGASAVLFDAPGIHGTVSKITDVSEEVAKAKAGVDLEALVPQGKKQTAQLEITVPADIAPGIHQLRIRTPLGTTGTMAFAIGALPEVSEGGETMPGTAPQAQWTKLPATLVGTISSPGNVDQYQFDGKAGEELVFQVQASRLGSGLNSLLSLSDASGRVLDQAGKYENGPDAELAYKLTQDGKYTLSITDREKSGGMTYFYRVNAGPLPYITGHFPLGVRQGESTNVTVSGLNLGDAREVKVQAPASAAGWATLPLAVQSAGMPSLNRVSLAVGSAPEITEREPNSTSANAEPVSLPVTINGHIDGGTEGNTDADYFRFHAKKGERLTVDVDASRLGSPLDSVIEILDAQGKPIPRATVRCLYQTTTTLSDRDSRTRSIRFNSISGFHEADFVMIGDELDQIQRLPDQPDDDVVVKGTGGLREAYLGTSPDVHAVNTPVYKVEVLAAGASFPPNGLPVFHLTWRNDDGGPGYGADSKLDFVAPQDGEYIVHLRDIRGLQGPDFAYRLTLHDTVPNFLVQANPANPNIPQGGSTRVTVAVDRLNGFDGAVNIEVKGLPQGVTANAAVIPPGQPSTVVVLSAAANVALDMAPAPIKILAHATIDGKDVVRTANEMAPADTPNEIPMGGLLQVASIMPPPDVIVTTDPREVSIEPGKDITVTLHIVRQNGFKGRVPCSVENLPPGVRVVNVGLNGVLVTESQTSRTFVLHAETWAKPIEQPIYVVAQVESDSPTVHPSDPLLVKVIDGTQTASVSQERPGDSHNQAPSR